MTAFHTIAVPHADILAGRLTLDVFAADLWEVYKGRAPDEYQDAVRFFQKTYVTEGLQALLAVVEQRLRGQGGDPVLQIQTPFGGGKTHALIALYHRAAAWNAQRVVIVGTPLAPTETPWGLLAEQLTGSRDGFTGPAAPGREALRALLAAHEPLLILMDEVLEYASKAATVKVGESTLATQTIAFLQELTEAVATLERTCLVITLPSSILEHYDESAERLFRQLQRVSGRVEKIYTPVQEHEITQVIRRRLFAQVDAARLAAAVGEWVEYALREGLLPAGMEPSEYRQRCAAAYPFLPEVIDVLYQRWGSFSSFQRTRGVLRLLALVVYALRESQMPCISLADFDLSQPEIRRELLKHIGPEYDSVIAADITGHEAGARKVDSELGAAYQGLRLGTRAATTVFMYSFSGGLERGATLGELKRQATTTANPASVVAEAGELLKGRLFYWQQEGGKAYFTNQPNLNRILLTRMEGVERPDILEAEATLLKARLGGQRLRVYLWEPPTGRLPEISDSPELKLAVLRERDEGLMFGTLKQKGVAPRVHGNTLFFLVALEHERPAFETLVRRYLALQRIEADKTLRLTPEQQREVKEGVKRAQGDLTEAIRRLYRLLFIPAREGLRELELGIPTYGDSRKLDEEIYDRLRTEGELLERIAPLVVRERYLRDREWVYTEQLWQVGSRTPGETRVVSRAVWEQGLAEGVAQGIFGLGELENGRPLCRYFKVRPSVGLTGDEVLIRAEVCQAQLASPPPPEPSPSPEPPYPVRAGGQNTSGAREPQGQETAGDSRLSGGGSAGRLPPGTRGRLRLRLTVPKGKVASLMGVMNFLQHKFNRLEITLQADEGNLTEQEYEDKIREAFRQMGVEVQVED